MCIEIPCCCVAIKTISECVLARIIIQIKRYKFGVTIRNDKSYYDSLNICTLQIENVISSAYVNGNNG